MSSLNFSPVNTPPSEPFFLISPTMNDHFCLMGQSVLDNYSLFGKLPPGYFDFMGQAFFIRECGAVFCCHDFVR